MITAGDLVGFWDGPPGGHLDEYLDFYDDGTGRVRLVTLGGDLKRRFRWRLLDSEGRLEVLYIDGREPDTLLSEPVVIVSVSDEMDGHGNRERILTLRAWHDDIMNDGEVAFPAGWADCSYRKVDKRLF